LDISDKGLMSLIAHEGIVQSRYKDSVGVWTIGVGHTAAAGGVDPAKFSGTMTLKEVFDLLRHDVAKYAAAVNRAVKVPLLQHQFDALVSFAYNVGSDIDADDIAEGLGDSTLMRKFNAGDFAGAAAEFGKWNKAKGQVLRGLTVRRAAESLHFQGKNWRDALGPL